MRHVACLSLSFLVRPVFAQTLGNLSDTDSASITSVFNSTENDLVVAAFRPFVIFCQCVVSWLVPLLIVFGVIGTSICLVGFLRRKSTQPEIQPWFVALTIADMYALLLCLSLFYISLLRHIFPNAKALINVFQLDSAPPELTCFATKILVYFGLLVSTWIQVGISILRVLSTQLPFTWRVQLNRRNSIIGLVTTVLFCLCVTFVMILTIHHVERKTDRFGNTQALCLTKPNNTFFYASLSLRVLIPLFCLTISSLIIIRSLREFTRTFSKDLGSVRLRNGSAGLSIDGTGLLNRTPRTSHHFSLVTSRASNSALITGPSSLPRSPAPGAYKRLIQHRISYILLGMNASFLIFTLPYELLKLYDSTFRSHIEPHEVSANATISPNASLSLDELAAKLRETVNWRIADRTLNILLYVNNATNWIFYFILGKQFRASIGRAMGRPSWLRRCIQTIRRTLSCNCSFCPRCLRRHRRHRHDHSASQHFQFQVYAHRSSQERDGQERCVPMPIYMPIRRCSRGAADARFHSH